MKHETQFFRLRLCFDAAHAQFLNRDLNGDWSEWHVIMSIEWNVSHLASGRRFDKRSQFGESPLVTRSNPFA